MSSIYSNSTLGALLLSLQAYLRSKDQQSLGLNPLAWTHGLGLLLGSGDDQ